MDRAKGQKAPAVSTTPTDDVLAQFFLKSPAALPLYQAVASHINGAFDGVRIKVSKTQISFSNRYGFAYVSLPHRKIKGYPEAIILLTFGLGRHEDDPRIFQAVEPYPGRWTHHVIIQSPKDINAQLMNWLREAYHFSLAK